MPTMRRGSGARHCLRLGAAGVLLAVALPGAAQQPAAAVPEKKYGDIEVTITAEGGKTVKSCTVHAKTQQASLARGEIVRRIPRVPAGRLAVTADAQVGQGWFRPAARYVGVTDTAVAADKLEKVVVVLRPVASINDYCSTCHPEPGQRVPPGQIARDVHVSGRELGPRYLAQVKKHNETVARLEKEGKPHNHPVPLEEREVVVDGRKVKKPFYTCESCHTLHLDLGFTDYARAPFRNKSDLCVACHF